MAYSDYDFYAVPTLKLHFLYSANPIVKWIPLLANRSHYNVVHYDGRENL